MFINLGFKSVTMDDIAKNLGISKKTIYNHFPTKTKLVEATTYYILHEITSGIEDIRKEDLNAVEELFEIKHFTMRHLKDERSSPQFQLEKYYPQIFKVVKKHHLEQMDAHVTGNIEKGISNGLYRKNIEVDFVSKLYFIGIMGMKDPDFFPPDRFAIHELYEKFLEYHLRAIVTEEGLKVLQQYLTTEHKNE